MRRVFRRKYSLTGAQSSCRWWCRRSATGHSVVQSMSWHLRSGPTVCHSMLSWLSAARPGDLPPAKIAELMAAVPRTCCLHHFFAWEVSARRERACPCAAAGCAGQLCVIHCRPRAADRDVCCEILSRRSLQCATDFCAMFLDKRLYYYFRVGSLKSIHPSIEE